MVVETWNRCGDVDEERRQGRLVLEPLLTIKEICFRLQLMNIFIISRSDRYVLFDLSLVISVSSINEVTNDSTSILYKYTRQRWRMFTQVFISRKKSALCP